MTTTALQLITDALGLVGVTSPGQDIEADDSALGLRLLNDLVDTWALSAGYSAGQAHLVYAVAGTVSSLTIGPGATLNMPRPVRLGDGFVRHGGYDYSFRMIDRASFDSLAWKGGGGQAPSVAYYNGAGTIVFAPPFTGGTLHLPVELPVAPFEALSSAQPLPQGYRRALVLTLAEDLAPHYSRDLPQRVVQRAINARRAIRRANLRVPMLRTGGPVPSPIFAGAFGDDDASDAYLLLEDGSRIKLEA